MDRTEAVKTPFRSAGRTSFAAPSPTRLPPPLENAQALLDALPLALIIVHQAGDGRWVIAAANTLFNTWAAVDNTGVLGLPIDLVDFLKQGELLNEFELFQANQERNRSEYRWTTQSLPRPRHYAVRMSRLPDTCRIQITFRDCTTEVETENGLRDEMLRDPLTGLPNRHAMAEAIDTLHKQTSVGTHSAILVIDVDRFSRINDSMGHLAGDELLITLARRIITILDDGEMLARIGGDVFALVVQGCENDDYPLSIGQKIHEALARPFRVNNQELLVRCTIGVALITSEPDDPDTLIGNAEFAVACAKRAGRRIDLYQQADASAARQRFNLETDLRAAIDNNTLTLAYQPIVEMKTGHITGVEALARWVHPEHGSISPNEFIPLAEEAGLIAPLGRRVLTMACQQLVEWKRKNSAARRLQISVNVSAIQFAHDDVVDIVRRTLTESGLPGRQLKIELTESAIIENPDRTTRVLEALKDLDVQIAMDDFGTGYSSLAYLQRLPIDVLKVDRSFVSGMMEQEDSFEIINAILSLARSLMMDTVAEGIETPEQAARLRSLGCEYGQGFFYSEPLAAADFITFLSAHQNQMR